MPAGFQSINDSGTVQIDENYSTLTLIAAPTITINGAGPGSAYPGTMWASYTVNSPNPQLFIGNTSGVYVAVVSRTNPSAGVWTYTFAAGAAVSVRLFIYSQAVMTAGNCGMQVFNSGGGLVFDSSAPFLRMSAVYQIGGAAGSSSFGIPQDGRAYAAALSYSRCSITGPGAGYYYWMAEWINVSGTTITTSTQGPIYRFPANNPYAYPPLANAPPQVLMVDVTYI
jgi:hypothetical protein